MNKKIIFPVVLGTLLICFVLSKCIGPKGQIELDWVPIPLNNSTPDSIILNVFLENSGSMDAYMCSGSNLKDAVFDYVSDLNKNTDSCNLYYINSHLIPCRVSLESYIKNLTPTSFAKAGGNRKNTDLREIIKTVLNNHTNNTVSVFISDCILDIPQSATDYFGNTQISIKNSFYDALAKYPNLGVQIAKLESKFDGYWFCGNNSKKLSDVKRPYYIWIIGDKFVLAKLNKLVPIKNIHGGILNYCAYSTSQTIPFEISNKRFAVNHAGIINDVEVIVDLSASLQEESLLVDVNQYTSSNPQQVKIFACRQISTQSNFSHVLSIELDNPENLKNVVITYSYPQLAEWVKLSNDSTGVYDNSVDKTTGILYLVKGVADAYKNHLKYGSIEFNIKNK